MLNKTEFKDEAELRQVLDQYLAEIRDIATYVGRGNIRFINTSQNVKLIITLE